MTIRKDGSATPDTPEEVSSETELRDAITAGKSVKLISNIDLTGELELGLYSGTIDLNTHTLNGGTHVAISINNIDNSNGRQITIKNGTIIGYQALMHNDSLTKLTVEGCKLIATDTENSISAVRLYGHITTVFKDCTFEAQSANVFEIWMGVNATLSGNTVMTGTSSSPIKMEDNISTLTCLAGTYSFDPNAYVDTTTYTVTPNTDGTWTVS